jgi:hypothetical protein
MTRLTYKQRLADIAGRLEGLAEDTATAADEDDLDVRVAEAVQEALDAIERAEELA